MRVPATITVIDGRSTPTATSITVTFRMAIKEEESGCAMPDQLVKVIAITSWIKADGLFICISRERVKCFDKQAFGFADEGTSYCE